MKKKRNAGLVRLAAVPHQPTQPSGEPRAPQTAQGGGEATAPGQRQGSRRPQHTDTRPCTEGLSSDTKHSELWSHQSTVTH